MIKLLLFFSLVISAYAETRTYLVKCADNFPQDRYLITISPEEYKRFIDTGKKTISEADGQPFRITSYVLNYNGKYALWTVSFKDADERWRMDSMESKGYITLLSRMDVVSAYDARKGGSVTEVTQDNFAPLPTDYYAVEASSS